MKDSWKQKVIRRAVTSQKEAPSTTLLSQAKMEPWGGIHHIPPPHSLRGVLQTGQQTPHLLPLVQQHPQAAILPPSLLKAKMTIPRPQWRASINPLLHHCQPESRQITSLLTVRWWGQDRREVSASWDAAVWCPMMEMWFMTNSLSLQCLWPTTAPGGAAYAPDTSPTPRRFLWPGKR